MIKKFKTELCLKLRHYHYLELLTTETMKLLGSTEIRLTKEKNGENLPQLEITEVVLIYYNIVHNDYICSNKSYGNLNFIYNLEIRIYQKFHQQIRYF